jgi:hypothetical protein
LGFFTRIPEQLSLHFYNFLVNLYRFYKVQLVNPKSVDVFLQKGPPIEYLRLQSGPGGGARLAGGEGWPTDRFDVPHFDRFKPKNFELKFKIAKYESCRPANPLQLS